MYVDFCSRLLVSVDVCFRLAKCTTVNEKGCRMHLEMLVSVCFYSCLLVPVGACWCLL